MSGERTLLSPATPQPGQSFRVKWRGQLKQWHFRGKKQLSRSDSIPERISVKSAATINLISASEKNAGATSVFLAPETLAQSRDS